MLMWCGVKVYKVFNSNKKVLLPLLVLSSPVLLFEVFEESEVTDRGIRGASFRDKKAQSKA